MSEARVGPVEAARVVRAARSGGPAVVEVLLATGVHAGARRLMADDGTVTGTLGDAVLDAVADDLARDALRADDALSRDVETAAGRDLLCAVVHRAHDELVIVGAGHIAVPLAELGVGLGFRVTVLDDREDFAEPARFPDQAAVRRVDFTDPFREVPLGPRCHIVLVTRAHRYDFDCLTRIVANDVQPAYLGMIGSRRRVRAAFQALLDAGVPRERLRAVRAPLGLDIGAETPEEIAVAVAAELVLLRRRGALTSVAALRDAERVLDRLLPEEPEAGD
jgi:xanthine dehydrogenase accessory factor